MQEALGIFGNHHKKSNNRIAKELAEGKKLCTSDFTTILHQDVFVQGG